MVELFENSGDPDQMLHSVASDLGLHCLPNTLLGDSRLQCVKGAVHSWTNFCREITFVTSCLHSTTRCSF